MKPELENLAKELRSADPEDDPLFSSLVKRSLELLEIPDQELSRRFDMSIPSVNRWRNGRSLPHPVMRPGVFRFFLEKVEQT